MAKRFGRNQRRKLKEAIRLKDAIIQRQAEDLHRRRMGEDAAIDAAFQKFLVHSRDYKLYIKEIVMALLQERLKQVDEAARGLLRKAVVEPSLDARLSWHPLSKGEEKVVIVRGVLPRIDYHVAAKVV